MAPQFVDISSFQGSIDFSAYSAWARQWDGVARIAMKATEGVGVTDPLFANNRAGALSAGIDSIIYYHFGRPDLGNSADAEARYVQSVVGNVRNSDIVILDYEVVSPSATANWAYTWLATSEQLYGGKLPGIYASLSYIQQNLQDQRLARYPLWLADWQFTPDERPACPLPWSQYEFLQYTDTATNIPGITGNVDADIFLGGPNVNVYSPNSADFNNWFTANDADHWTCKQTGVSIQYGNKALFSQLSIDGNTLPVLGLPRTSELAQHDADSYYWSVQFFERGVIVYDPAHRQDNQPGFTDCYIGKYPQFLQLDPAYQPIVVNKIPDSVVADIKAVKTASEQLATDANVS